MAILSTKWSFESSPIKPSFQRYLLSILTLFSNCLLLADSTEELLQKARSAYEEGLKAEHYQERKILLNKALNLYQTAEESNPNSSSLNQSLAETYFSLGQTPWAILYYKRALKNDLKNVHLLTLLRQAEDNLKLPLSQDTQGTIKGLLYTLSQNFTLLFAVILLVFLTASAHIWLSYPFLQKLTILFSVIMSLILINALFFYFTPPLEAVMIKSSGFYKKPDLLQPQLTNIPLPAGSTVQILEITTDGQWLKINQGRIVGYVPTDHLRKI